jgi:hypothetical protein
MNEADIACQSAIIGQVALTALSLPGLNQTHWTARAFLIAAMVLGVLTVVASSYQQMSIGMLNKAVEIRLWLSDDFDDGQEVPTSQITELREYVLNGKFPLRSSLSAQQLIRLPFALLGWGVYSFLVGFGLYLGFAWANHIDTDLGKNDNRNVLIVFLFATLLSILLFAIWSIMKASEQIGTAPPIGRLQGSPEEARAYQILPEPTASNPYCPATQEQEPTERRIPRRSDKT